LGLINLFKEEYTLAMQYSFRSLKLYESIENKNLQARVLSTMAFIMLAEEEFGRAYDFALQSQRIFTSLEDSVSTSTPQLVIAECLAKEGNFEEAKKVARNSLNVSLRLGYKEGVSHAWLRLGNISFHANDYPGAKVCYETSIRHGDDIHHVLLLIHAYTRMAKVQLKMHSPDSAYQSIHKALALARRNQYSSNELSLYQLLTEYFTAKGEKDSVLHYTQIGAALEHEIFDRQRREQLITLQMLSGFEEKDKELLFQKRIVRRQYIAISGVTVILILSIIFGFRVFALNKSNREAKEALMELNTEKNRVNENLESLVVQRTEQLKTQNQKILEYAFTIAHEVRGPLARILGLIELAKIRELSEEDKKQIMVRLEDASNELDDIIRAVNRKLETAKSD
jgi:tetratricopeptide (TPR) repeat protein